MSVRNLLTQTNKVTIEVLSESATGFQVKVKSGLVPVGYGTYDERSALLMYTGSWVAQAVTGNYLNTEKYSKVIGSTAQFYFYRRRGRVSSIGVIRQHLEIWGLPLMR